jgi:hypothetical protein
VVPTKVVDETAIRTTQELQGGLPVALREHLALAELEEQPVPPRVCAADQPRGADGLTARCAGMHDPEHADRLCCVLPSCGRLKPQSRSVSDRLGKLV